jgi:hypothetical protein
MLMSTSSPTHFATASCLFNSCTFYIVFSYLFHQQQAMPIPHCNHNPQIQDTQKRKKKQSAAGNTDEREINRADEPNERLRL